MSLPERASPAGKRVSLFVTCMVDMLYPETGMAVVEVLERLGVEVEFPGGQTCCGQPAFNAGYWEEARQVAEHFLDTFKEAEVIVVPSGSCAAMVRHEYPHLFAGEPARRAEAERLAGLTWEFTEFLVDGLGVTDLKARVPGGAQTFAFHDACHGLRLLGLGAQSRILLGSLENVTLQEMPGSEVCCGFGGLFSVKMPDVSGGMLQRKKEQIAACPAQVLTGDVSCMTHINGGLAREGMPQRVCHIADVLAAALRGASDASSIE